MRSRRAHRRIEDGRQRAQPVLPRFVSSPRTAGSRRLERPPRPGSPPPRFAETRWPPRRWSLQRSWGRPLASSTIPSIHTLTGQRHIARQCGLGLHFGQQAERRVIVAALVLLPRREHPAAVRGGCHRLPKASPRLPEGCAGLRGVLPIAGTPFGVCEIAANQRFQPLSVSTGRCLSWPRRSCARCRPESDRHTVFRVPHPSPSGRRAPARRRLILAGDGASPARQELVLHGRRVRSGNLSAIGAELRARSAAAQPQQGAFQRNPTPPTGAAWNRQGATEPRRPTRRRDRAAYRCQAANAAGRFSNASTPGRD